MKKILPILTFGALTAFVTSTGFANPLFDPDQADERELETEFLIQSMIHSCGVSNEELVDLGKGTCNGDDPECESMNDPESVCEY